MYLHLLRFGASKHRGKQHCEDLVERYLDNLFSAGQVLRYFLGWHKKSLNAHVLLPRPDSLKLEYHMQLGKESLEKVVAVFGREPKCIPMEDDIPKRFPKWQSATSLYVFSHSCESTMPIHRGDDGQEIPAYLLPIGDAEKFNIHCWERIYADHINVWVNAEKIQTAVYKEIVDPASELSMCGRELCKEIEEATSLPTYYYLFRFWGRKKNEEARLCPGCGGKWRQKKDGKGIWKPGKNGPSDRKFHEFPFRCESCRLVSHDTDNSGDERRAAIGEFRK